MSIVFDPKNMLKKAAPEAKIKRMIRSNFSLKRSVLGSLGTDQLPLDEKALSEVALKTIRGYKQRIAKAQVDAGFERSAGKEVADEILADPAQLIQRVQNEIVFQTHNLIKENYQGQRAVWLPSSASEPRPEHQLNYGKEYNIGEGIDGVERRRQRGRLRLQRLMLLPLLLLLELLDPSRVHRLSL